MINHAEELPEDRIIKEIADLRRDIEAMKAKQLIGADNLPVLASSEGSYTSVYPAGSVGGLIFNVFAAAKRRYLSEVKVTFYINNDLNPNYAWPYGASITPSQLDVSMYCDLYYSDETGVGNKSYIFRLANTSASSITLYMHLAIIYPQQTLSLS